jgi:hypothetical protein
MKLIDLQPEVVACAHRCECAEECGAICPDSAPYTKPLWDRDGARAPVNGQRRTTQDHGLRYGHTFQGIRKAYPRWQRLRLTTRASGG